jgi:hypothetical protein
MDTKWREILEQVERGELTPEQGAERLAAQTKSFEPEETGSANEPRPEPTVSEPEVVEDFQNVLSFWKRWWTVPLWAGVIVCVLSGLAMSSAAAAGRMFWFYCAIIPALLGAFGIMLSFWSRKSRWVHVRIGENKAGRRHKIAISLPIPTALVGWGLETFGHLIPGLRDQPETIKMMPELLKAIDETGDPLVVEVNEKDGDEVRVYIM